MARRRSKRSHRSGTKKIPLAVVIPMAMSAYGYVGEPLLHGDAARAQRQAAYYMGGQQEDGSGFQLDGPMKFYGPILLGVIAHRLLGKHVNRYIPKGIPIGI